MKKNRKTNNLRSEIKLLSIKSFFLKKQNKNIIILQFFHEYKICIIEKNTNMNVITHTHKKKKKRENMAHPFIVKIIQFIN